MNAPADACTRIIRPGRNCGTTARAERLALLIDGESYFGAVRSSILAARRSVEIVAWDIDGRIRLVRGDDGDEQPTTLSGALVDALKRHRELEVRVLEWDFSMIYALEREWTPLLSKPPWPSHPRLRFRFDANHPVGASHHQKIVVVDGRVAFVGGMDLSKWRWDSREHRAEDPRRVDPQGDSYPTYHDAQVVLDGDAAHGLARIVRQRWLRATGERIEVATTVTSDPWPEGLHADLYDVEVGIARTDPAHDGREEVREVEALMLDSIRQARRSIYIENQFLTSASVTEALARRLAAEDGPEVVIVLPFRRNSWLEEYSMGIMRSRCLRRLRGADRFDRLRVYYPHQPELDVQVLNVHSKLLIVDERFLCIGSANLSNRSMGLDTECNIAVEGAGASDEVADRIRRLQTRLVAHQLDVPEGELAETLRQSGRWGRAIDTLRSGEHRSLRPLDGLIDEFLEQALPESTLFDPERPLEPDAFVEEILGADRRAPATRRLLIGGGFVAALLVLGALWRWSPLAERVHPDRIALWLDGVSGVEGAVAWVLGLFVAGSVVGLPISALVVAVNLAFDGWRAVTLAWAGAMAGALITYGLGNVLGPDLVRRLFGKRINRLSRGLARHGLVAVITLRIVPLAPFTLVNLVMGASPVRFRHYLLGTMVGMLPGILAITLFVDRILAAIREATVGNWLTAVGLGTALGAALWLVRRHLVVSSPRWIPSK